MELLNEQQRQRTLVVLKEYIGAPSGPDGKTPIESYKLWDKERVGVIDNDLKPLLERYLSGNVSLSEFKSQVDGINKRNNLWGFRGIKGQMFFNMVVNVADDQNECDQELKAALSVPANEQIASSRIKTFASFVKRLGDQWVESGKTGYGRPKVSSVPFFLSYFWQIHDRDVWPAYYTNTIQMMTDLNLWQPSEDIAQDYLSFKRIHEELIDLFNKNSGQLFDLYKVEHVFWFKGKQQETTKNKTITETGKDINQSIITSEISENGLLPESYVPPIVLILPTMAINDTILREAAKRSGIALERAFEKNVDAAFTILGYETKLLGQGKGRVPDGLAIARDDNYAIIWDAKVRETMYSMGTDDRAIREYITTQSRELKRRNYLRNVYYLIISSKFAEDYDEAIRSIKMETDVSEVVLAEADAMVAMVDAKLRAPLQISLGPDGLQRLFTDSGVITSETVKEQLS